MRIRLGATLVVCFIVSAAAGPLAQKAAAPPPKKNPLLKLTEPWPPDDVLQAARVAADSRRLFRDTDPLTFTLTADFSAVNKERTPENKKLFPAAITVVDAKGPQDLAVKIGSRGHFRLMARNCDFVPIRVEFPRDGETGGTIFEAQTSLKLGTHCRSDREYDNYTLREYLTYRLFNLVTPLSFRARLARATYVDVKTKKSIANRYAILIEHENEVARRFGGRVVELQRIVFDDLDPATLNRMMLFEYMIGNTDFSIWALHNVRLVQDPNRKLYPVPYDFDLSGFVHAPYATPDPRIGIRSVLDRLYRGPCRTIDQFDEAAQAFRAKREDMFTLLDSMKDLEPSARSEARNYLEASFRAIERPDSIRRQLVSGCKPQPTM
ncbi:MAG TPA: hypothetical protein VKE96_13580 [Vicinamibacterales bacterium]|nr:hypothetical protein [Vicinamibacterales bacterium]